MTTGFLQAVTDGKEALLALVAADAEFADASVQFSMPRDNIDARGSTGVRELFYFVDEERDSGTFDIGPSRAGVSPYHDVAGRFDLKIEVIHEGTGTTRYQCEKRAAVLADAVVLILENDPAVGLGADGTDEWDGLQLLPDDYTRRGIGWEPTGHACDVVLTVQVVVTAC